MPDSSVTVESRARPDPDPTVLTTQQLLREIGNLKEVLETRLNAMDKAIVLLQAYPTEVDRKVGQLKELTEEKFRSVGDQFIEKDKAVVAAFAAAREAIAESKAIFVKQIDQLTVLIQANKVSADDKISDMKDRMNRGEGRSTGHGEIVGYIFGGAGFIAAIAAIAASLLR